MIAQPLAAYEVSLDGSNQLISNLDGVAVTLDGSLSISGGILNRYRVGGNAERPIRSRRRLILIADEDNEAVGCAILWQSIL
jgi:hypothetical protein